jgi:hypothetical protein
MRHGKAKGKQIHQGNEMGFIHFGSGSDSAYRQHHIFQRR